MPRASIGSSILKMGFRCLHLVLAILGALFIVPSSGQENFGIFHTLPNPRASEFTNQYFGWNVAISGHRLFVGAPAWRSTNSGLSCVYAYDLNGTNPLVPALTFTSANSNVFDAFGSAVACSETRLIVGLHLDNTGASASGSVYVYDLESPSPATSPMVLTNPSPAASDSFGVSVAISGTRVVVGSKYDNTGALHAGSAYVYDLASATPTLPMLILTNPTPATPDEFGSSVAISDNWVVVGARFDRAAAFLAGSAYVYDLSAAIPSVPVNTLTNPAKERGLSFGSSVAISGTRIVVGAHANSSYSQMQDGNAYVYDLMSATPEIPVITLNNPTPEFDELFGASVAISGTRVVVGTVENQIGAPGAGSAYVYDLASRNPALPVATIISPIPAAKEFMGASVALNETTIVASAPFGDNRGVVHVFGLLPALKIASASPGFATVSWTPTNSTGFVLQYTDQLASIEWLNAPTGVQNPVEVSVTNATRFYRLSRP